MLVAIPDSTVADSRKQQESDMPFQVGGRVTRKSMEAGRKMRAKHAKRKKKKAAVKARKTSTVRKYKKG